MEEKAFPFVSAEARLILLATRLRLLLSQAEFNIRFLPRDIEASGLFPSINYSYVLL